MIGENLSHYMREQGYTQETLALKSGISQSTISAIINGASKPKPGTLAELASALGITKSQLETAELLPSVLACPRCGSKVVLEWSNHASGACRIKCGYCEADTGEQNSREKAVHIFLGFKRAEQSKQDLHVLSLAELLDSTCYDADDVRPVWFENRGLFIVPSLLQCGIAEQEQGLARVLWVKGFSMKSFTLEQYGFWWRCWSAKATQAQSDSVPWDGE